MQEAVANVQAWLEERRKVHEARALNYMGLPNWWLSFCKELLQGFHGLPVWRFSSSRFQVRTGARRGVPGGF